MMSTTFFIPSTVSSWKKFDLNIINNINRSCLNLVLNKNTIKSPKIIEDSIHYIMACPLHQNENFKVKCKGHNFFSDFHIFR
jgi:hypothetical protein